MLRSLICVGVLALFAVGCDNPNGDRNNNNNVRDRKTPNNNAPNTPARPEGNPPAPMPNPDGR
jgi:hypothetical protein